MLLILACPIRRISWIPAIFLVPLLHAAGQQSEPPEPQWREFVVSPRVIREPVLDVRLFPLLMERTPGNAAPAFLRMAWETTSDYWAKLRGARDLLKVPPDKLDVVEARELSIQYDEFRQAALYTAADWQYPIHSGVPLNDILLPDIQQSRDLFAAHALQCRCDILEGNLDLAIEKLKIGFAAARHYEATPFLISRLVVSVYNEMLLDQVAELIQHEEAPNFYWALAALPRPLVRVRDCIDVERGMLESIVPELRNLDSIQGAEEWSAVSDKLLAELRSLSHPFADLTRGLSLEEIVVDQLPRWREELPSLPGYAVRMDSADRVLAMSGQEVAIRYLTAVHRQLQDETFTAMLLDTPRALDHLRELKARKESFVAESPILAAMLYHFPNSHLQFARIRSMDRYVDALRIVESIRDYAARHDGRFPETLDELITLPAPDDEFTGEAFEYRVDDNAAWLRGDFDDGSPDEEPSDAKTRYTIRWKIVLR